jgi:hypothetical protein
VEAASEAGDESTVGAGERLPQAAGEDRLDARCTQRQSRRQVTSASGCSRCPGPRGHDMNKPAFHAGCGRLALAIWV